MRSNPAWQFWWTPLVFAAALLVAAPFIYQVPFTGAHFWSWTATGIGGFCALLGGIGLVHFLWENRPNWLLVSSPTGATVPIVGTVARDRTQESITDLLRRHSRMGRMMRDEIRSRGPTITQFENICTDWANTVHRDLEERLPAKAEWFMDEYVAGGQQWQPGAPLAVANWGNYMDRRLSKLAEIIRELG